MQRWLVWLGVGFAIYVLGVILYAPLVESPRIVRLVATIAFRLWVYATGAVLIYTIATWLLRPRSTRPLDE